jgi:hypothetical protein
MANVLNNEKKQQILALGQLGWSLRRIQEATHVRRETISTYMKVVGTPTVLVLLDLSFQDWFSSAVKHAVLQKRTTPSALWLLKPMAITSSLISISNP